MRNAIIALAAAAAPLVAASTVTSSSGGALIINKCSIDIPMEAVPASGTDVDEASSNSTTLLADDVDGSTFFTNWISLGDDGGWSLKLNPLGDWDNIMQYEYTWTGDSEVWYDMSFVNGDESDFPDWEFIAGDGEATTNAYEYSTDDEEGMNAAVSTSVTVTLILCPASTGADSATSTSDAVATNNAETTTTAAAAITTTTTTSSQATTTAAQSTTLQRSSTTLATAYSSLAGKEVEHTTTTKAAADADPVIVTEYATEVVTAVVTEVAHAKVRRHEHRHPHGHHA